MQAELAAIRQRFRKSDQHPSQFCPRGVDCPSRAAQLSLCPSRTCPLGRYGQETSVDDADIDISDRRAVRALVTDLARDLIPEVAAPLLRQHRMRMTGRLD